MIEDEGNLTKAYTLAFFGDILFALAQVFFKMATKTLAPFQVLYFRSICLLLLALIVLQKKDLSVYIPSHNIFKKIVTRVMIMGGGAILIYESLAYIPVSTVNTIDNLAPIFIFFIEAIAYKKKPDFISLILAVISFIGVVLIIQPDFLFGSDHPQPVQNYKFYVTLVILAAIFTAINAHFVYGLAKELHYTVNMTYSYLGYVFISSTICNIDFKKNHLDKLQWEFLFIMIGLVACAFSSAYMLVISKSIVKPSKTMPLGYFGIVVSFLADVYIFGTKFTFLPVLGMLLTSVSLLSQVLRNQLQTQEEPKREEREVVEEVMDEKDRTSR